MDRRSLAHALRTAYGLEPTQITTLSASDTTVYRIRVGQDAYVLRIHGTHTDVEVASNMAWLHALQATRIGAPRPLRTRDGAWVSNHATLVSWVDGRRQQTRPVPVHYERLGTLMARLHRHVETWAPPTEFARPSWRAAEVLCERGIGAPPSGSAWRLVPDAFVATLREACAMARPALDAAPTALIHADLHLGNVVFRGGQAHPIDFDDAGIGPLGYDVASALSPVRLKAIWPQAWSAFATGYEQIRPLPDLARLDALIVGRLAGLALWSASMAQTLERWQPRLPGWLGAYCEQLRRLLDGAPHPRPA